AGRPELDLDAGRLVVLASLRQPEPALSAREERRGDICEAVAHGRERLLEAAVHRLGELGAKLLQLGARTLDVRPLRLELLETGSLALVLLLRKGVHRPDRCQTAFDALELGPQLVGVVALLRLRVSGPF